MSSFHSRDDDVEVDDAGQRVGQVGQLVVVRGEDRLRPRPRVRREVLGDGPGEAQAVEGRGAAADLVEDDEAARRGGVQDVGGLLHLDHEGRLAARDVVGGADAREDAVDDRQLGARAPARTIRPAPSGRAAPSAAGRSTCRPCSGPVRMMSWRVAASSVTSFGTNASRRRGARRPGAGRRSPTSSSPSCTCGLV